MQPKSLNEIRKKYLEFFESKGHLCLNSFPLVPQDDDSLLLINAGMAPLKKYFTGERVPPRKRVTTCQKCVRTLDIDNVGKTARQLFVRRLLLAGCHSLGVGISYKGHGNTRRKALSERLCRG